MLQKTAFSRKRKISFTDTILSVLSMEKSSSKHEMLKYFDFSADTPSLSALIQQRSKLSPEAFQILFRDFTDSFNFGKNLKGYRLLAVYGSDICIPRDPEDPETYRISDPYGKGYNLLHLNALYDLLSRTYIDAILHSHRNIISKYITQLLRSIILGSKQPNYIINIMLLFPSKRI